MKKNNKAEFDFYIENYRKEQDKHLWMTGDDSEYFARYKVHKLAAWNTHLLSRKNKILDFGCGDGLMSYYLAHYFNQSEVFGADISADSIEQAREMCPNVTFEVIDQGLPYDDSYFDIVCAAGVFHHIPFSEHQHWIAELIRVTKPNGLIILFELNPLNPGTQYIFRNHPMEKNAKMLWPWYTKKLLAQVGKPLNQYLCYFPSWLSWFRFLEPFLETWCIFGGLYASSVLKKDLANHQK